MKEQALKKLEVFVKTKFEPKQNQIVNVKEIKKNDGVMKIEQGVQVYVVLCQVTLQFIKDGWLMGNMFEGYWSNGIYDKDPNPNVFNSGLPYTSKKYPRGTVVTLNCLTSLPRSDNGFSVRDFTVQSESNKAMENVADTKAPSKFTKKNDEAASSPKSNDPVLKSKFSGNVANDFVLKSLNFSVNKNIEKNDVLFLFTYQDGVNENLKPEVKENIISQFKSWIEKSIKGTPVDLSTIKADSIVKIELVITTRLSSIMGLDAFIKTRVNVTKNGSQLVDESFERSKSLMVSNEQDAVLESSISNSKKKIAKVLGAFMKIE